ncbi:hypothetical protein DN545_36785, partial [Burkholderia multivorans]
HDRFLRAVDRYYATAVAIHEAAPSATGTDEPGPAGIGTVDADQAAASARDILRLAQAWPPAIDCPQQKRVF